MITFAILILIVAKALPGLNTHISSIHVTRITSIVFLFAGALSLNSLNLESIGSGIGIYCGLFQVTSISQLIEIFLFMIGGGILIAWPQIKYNLYLPASFGGKAGKIAQHRYLGPAPSSVAPVANPTLTAVTATLTAVTASQDATLTAVTAYCTAPTAPATQDCSAPTAPATQDCTAPTAKQK